MPNILIISRSNWTQHLGAGGRHRSHQIQVDVESAFGADNLRILTPGKALLEAEERSDRIKGLWRIRHAIKTARLIGSNPLRLTHLSKYESAQVMTSGFVDEYQRFITGDFQPDVCVLEDARFAPLIAINHARGIPTIMCPHKFEAPLSGGIIPATPAARRVHMLDFAAELDAYAACEARLFISRVEAGFVGGLGVPSQHYPYVPRGGLRDRLEKIRAARHNGSAERGLLLLIGRASFPPTRRSFEWLLSQLDLPDDMRLDVIGLGAEKLPQSPGVTLRGWLEHDELDALLMRATAVLLPSQVGFGTPTRLADMAVAGVPVIASTLLTHTVDSMPNVIAVENDGAAWRAALERIADFTIPPEAEAVFRKNGAESKLVETINDLTPRKSI